MVAAFIGGSLIKMAFVPFSYGGIVTYMILPDPLLWHFTLISLVGIRIGIFYWTQWKVEWAGAKKGMGDGEPTIE